MFVGASGEVLSMLLNITTTQTQTTSTKCEAKDKTLQAILTGAGAINATVNIYGANVDSFAFGGLLGTLTPSGTNTAHDEIILTEAWPFMWADCTALQPGATLTVTIGA